MSDKPENICLNYGFSFVEFICTLIYYVKFLAMSLYNYIYQSANDDRS